jgi:transcriptional regulatory protein RtcR
MTKRKLQVCIGLLGARSDSGSTGKWRPTVSLCAQAEFKIDRFELLHLRRYAKLAASVAEEIRATSPHTSISIRPISLGDPWDFQQVYGALYSFAKHYAFKIDREEYYLHITTGTQVAQICMFMLAASHRMPAKLIQSLPPASKSDSPHGSYNVIDLDLEKYEPLAALVRLEQRENALLLKDGIDIRNAAFNRLIAQVERVAHASNYPILLTGPTGAGKSQLARRIYELKKRREPRLGKFVEVNCATIRGDVAMSTLFGHVPGAFTGAGSKPRAGLLLEADGGVLFLDEIGCLGLDEQAMMLRALEVKTFFPLGSDREAKSSFQLIAGTNSDLDAEVEAGKFREDLLARISDWTFRLPPLSERIEDIEPNLRYELDKFAAEIGRGVTFTSEAERKYLDFSVSTEAKWTRNFRDLNVSVRRMATLADGGRVTLDVVNDEIDRLRTRWCGPQKGANGEEDLLRDLIGEERLLRIDLFDKFHLAGVVKICLSSSSLSDAGRKLYDVSRTEKHSTNDAARLRKYLERYGLSWRQIQEKAKRQRLS